MARYNITKYTSMYKSSLGEIDSLLEKLFKKYADKSGKISYLTVLENQRLLELKAGVLAELKSLNTRVTAFQLDNAAKIFLSSVKQTKSNIKKLAGLNITDDFYFPEQGRLVAGKTLAMRISENTGALYGNINDIFTDGFTNGHSFIEIARQIKEQTNMTLNDSLRIARTEGHWSQNQGKIDVLNRATDEGLKIKKRWVATHDDRTRSDHLHLDGVEINVDEDFDVNGDLMAAPGLGSDPTENINCRCSFIEVVDGFALK